MVLPVEIVCKCAPLIAANLSLSMSPTLNLFFSLRRGPHKTDRRLAHDDDDDDDDYDDDDEDYMTMTTMTTLVF